MSKTVPTIQANDRQLRSIVADAWDAIHEANIGPQIFGRGGAIVRLEHHQDGPLVRPMDTTAAMYGLVFRVANWAKLVGDKLRNCFPPREVAADILCFPDSALPQLDDVVAVPIFGSQGNLIAEPGYHPDERLWLHIPECLKGLLVPESPTPQAIREARELLLNDLLWDFPFAEDSDKAHAVAGALLQFVRRMIRGRTPIHLIESPIPGSGKGLLADQISLLAMGRPCDVTTLPSDRDGDEIRKKITSILLKAPSIILLDNALVVASGHLAAAITANPWCDRILGKSRFVELPNRATWLVTSNNPNLSTEIVRRSIRIRLDPGSEEPWLRTGFKHDPLPRWTLENRGRLVSAILTLVRAWIAAGRPLFRSKVLGSFEEWSQMVGGIMEVAAIPGFLSSVQDQIQDPEALLFRAFVEEWWRRYAFKPVGVADLVVFAGELDLGGGSEQSQRIRLGKMLVRMRDGRFGEYRIHSAGTYQGGLQWKLVKVP